MIGNGIIIISSNQFLSTIGYETLGRMLQTRDKTQSP